MKKGDIILILLILLVAGSAFGIYRAFTGSGGGEAVVYVDGEEEGRYSLNEDQTIEINGGTNTLVIEMEAPVWRRRTVRIRSVSVTAQFREMEKVLFVCLTRLLYRLKMENHPERMRSCSKRGAVWKEEERAWRHLECLWRWH